MPSQKGQHSQPEQTSNVNNDSYEYEDESIALNGPRKSHRIRVLAGSTETAASFQIDDEDHTLGNALRWMIMKNPDVELCGYSIPHPAEAKLNIRIQTYEGTTALDALEKGLDDLVDLCDVVGEKFEHAMHEFNKNENKRRRG